MSLTDLLTVSGAVAWFVLGWRGLRYLKGLGRRLRWALITHNMQSRRMR